MALSEEDVQFIKKHISEWFAEANFDGAVSRREFDLLERIIRVEEETKHLKEESIRLRQDMLQSFDRMDQRFDRMDQRFDRVDQRFVTTDKRFDKLMYGSFAIAAAIPPAVVALLKLWPA